MEPTQIQKEHTDRLIQIAVLGLIVNIIGVIFFHDYAKPRSEVRHAHQENVHSLFVHIFLDGIGSVGVIVSTWLMDWGWLYADPTVAIGIVILIVYNAIPICSRTGKVLLQTKPMSIADQLDKALREASTVEGVLECRNEHFWTQSPGVFVGSFYVRVRSDANEQQVSARVNSIFSPLITHLTVQIEKDDWLLESRNDG